MEKLFRIRHYYLIKSCFESPGVICQLAIRSYGNEGGNPVHQDLPTRRVFVVPCWDGLVSSEDAIVGHSWGYLF